MSDFLQRFVFEHTDIRGELVRVEQSYQQALSNHDYPAGVAQLLGEFIAAVALLSATLKFDGTISLQARSEGEIPLIMAEATSERGVRAIAKDAEDASSTRFQDLLARGQLAITIDPTQGRRYQGIVSLQGPSLARCLEQYFEQSEQLSTRLWLASDGVRASGLLLQELPSDKIRDQQMRQQQWEHVYQLAQTVKPEELQTLDPQTLLHRLYHQETLRLYPAQTLQFQCSCSRERTASALRSLGKVELESILAEQGELAINCEFCHRKYLFDQQQLKDLIHPVVH